MFPWCLNFLEEISSLSHSVVFLYFFALIAEEGFLISPCYSLELCIEMLVSFLFSFAFLLINTLKRCPFHYRGLECKSRKSRNTWSNKQILPWNAEWSRAKANRVLPRECTGCSNHPLPTTQHHQMVNTKIRLIVFYAAKDGEALYSQQKQDQELTVAQVMNSLLPKSDLNWRK